VREILAGLGGRFRHLRLIERFASPPSSCTRPALEVTFTTPRRTVLAWTASAGVHAAAGGGVVQTISTTGCLADLAVGGADEAAILVSEADGTLVDALRPFGATRFGALEPLATGARPGAAAFAFDPATGHLVAVWVDADELVLKSSLRDPVTS
jgi:hypothetical protein